MNRRSGFTLVELLVVVSILLIMTTITVATLNAFTNAERIRSSARQVQSSLMGARDRAIRFQAPRGVRFLVNPNASVNGNVIVDSMVYIQPVSPDTNKGGGKTVWLERPSSDGGSTADSSDVTIIRAKNVGWLIFANQGLLVQGARIKIPNTVGGQWYTVTYNGDPRYPLYDATTKIYSLILSSPYNGGGINTFNGIARTPVTAVDAPVTYQLELAPIIMPNQEPMRLSSNVGIDMNLSSQFSTQTNYFDVMYSPRGTVHGWLSSYGIVYFYLRELDDVVGGTAKDPANPKAKQQLICTLYTQTGNVITSDVNPTDLLNNTAGQWPVNGTPSSAPAGADGFADDPFLFARNGKKAGR